MKLFISILLEIILVGCTRTQPEITRRYYPIDCDLFIYSNGTRGEVIPVKDATDEQVQKWFVKTAKIKLHPVTTFFYDQSVCQIIVDAPIDDQDKILSALSGGKP